MKMKTGGEERNITATDIVITLPFLLYAAYIITFAMARLFGVV